MTELEKLIRESMADGTSDKDIVDAVASVLHTIKSEEKAKNEAKLAAERAEDMKTLANILNKYVVLPEGIEEKITAEDVDAAITQADKFINEVIKGFNSAFDLFAKSETDPLSKFLEDNELLS